jgi:glycosyltransferase involved in cell wall biosynthesis
MEKIKILHYNPLFLPSLGGTEVNTYLFAKHSKHKHCVLTDLLPGTPFYEKIDDIDVYRVGPARLLAESNRLNFILECTLGAVRELNKAVFLRKIDFDVMHLHGSYGFPILFDTVDKLLGRTIFKRLLAWRTCRKPIVLTLHSTPSHDIPFKPCFLSKPFPTLKERRSWLGLEMLYRREADFIICVDRYMATLMNSLNGRAQVFYIASGVDTRKFRPIKKKKAYNLLPKRIWSKIERHVKNFLVLYLGRFDLAKGTHFLKDFAKKLPPDIKLIVAGHGDLTLLGRSKEIIYVGKIENNNVPALINSSDAIFNPVLFIGTSRVTFEGMACGKPVIMFDNGVDRYPLINGKNGILVSNIDEAVEKVVQLKKKPSFYKKISREAIKTARRNSVQNLAKKVDKLYEALAL